VTMVKEAEPVMRLRLRPASPIAGQRGGEILDRRRFVGWRMDRTGAHRLARAFFGDCGEAGSVALPRQAHRAMMLAVAAAAGRQTRIGIRAEKWDDQYPTEDRQQRE